MIHINIEAPEQRRDMATQIVVDVGIKIYTRTRSATRVAFFMKKHGVPAEVAARVIGRPAERRTYQ